METPCYDDVWRTAYGDIQEHGPAHRHMRRLLARVARSLEYRTVLDVGCGAGDNVSLLTEGRDLDAFVGVDVSAEALTRARARHRGRFVRADIERETVDGRYDLVFSSLVLEHLPDDVSALRNMREMTAGHLLVTTIAGDFDRHRRWEDQVGHVRNYRRGELEGKLSEVGFEVRQSMYWGFPFYSPLARRLQNRMSAEPAYGPATRVVATAMHALYFLNSRRCGDLLVVLAAPRQEKPAIARSESSSDRVGA